MTVRLTLRLFSREGQSEHEVVCFLPHQGDHLFFQGGRYEVIQVQHHIPFQKTVVLARFVD